MSKYSSELNSSNWKEICFYEALIDAEKHETKPCAGCCETGGVYVMGFFRGNDITTSCCYCDYEFVWRDVVEPL